jgi:hypothetical protein
MRRIIMSSMACLALPYLSTLSQEQQDFWKKTLLDIKCVLSFSTTISEIFLIMRGIWRNLAKFYYNMRMSSCKIVMEVAFF